MNFKDLFSKPHYAFSFLAKTTAVLIVIVILIYGIYGMSPDMIAGTDFVQLYLGAKILVSDLRQQIYDVSTQTFFFKEVVGSGYTLPVIFRAFPTILVFFVPLTFLSLHTAYRVFLVINLILVFWAIKLLQDKLQMKCKSYLILFTLAYWPTILAVLLGQTSLIFLILFLVIYRSVDVKPSTAGFLCSFLISKLPFLLFIPFLVVISRDRRKFLRSFVMGTLGLIFLSLILVGWQALIKYPSFILNTEIPLFGSRPGGLLNLASLFYVLRFNSTITLFLNGAFYILVLLFFIKKWKEIHISDSAFFAAIIFTVIFSYHIGQYDLVILSIPMLALLKSYLATYKWVYLVLTLTLLIIPFLQYSKLAFTASIFLLAVGVWFLKARKSLV